MKFTPDAPQPGQESVWDYPRPPRLEHSSKHVEVYLGGVKIADTRGAYRVLETSHPPVYYVPRESVLPDVLHLAAGTSLCEFKGAATYWTARVGEVRSERAAWSYERPTPAFAAITGYVAFYPGRVDACLVDGERVTPQSGDFYGGWITRDIAGPFKGGPGSSGW